MISRIVENQMQQQLFKGKSILLLGARQVGKSTLLKQLIAASGLKSLSLDAEEADVPPLFEAPNATKLRQIIGDAQLLIIDEAQKIENIGAAMKIIVDHLPQVQVIATGSSAFDLKQKAAEPLTGRKWEYYLYPFSFAEMVNHHGLLHEKRLLAHRLIYGAYPEVALATDDPKLRLRLLSESYLYKDVLLWSGLKKPEKIIDLLRALSHQVGHEVSYQELGNMLSLKGDTIESYIQILEQAFIIFRLPSYAVNARKELRKGKKIYFYDNGIRNALINDFRFVETRQDVGALWENYVIAELWKKNQYDGGFGKFYFWRTADQQEIDLIIEKDTLLQAYEIKWNVNATARLSKTFSKAYPNHQFDLITPNNIDTFLL